jgi:hypothetical protein
MGGRSYGQLILDTKFLQQELLMTKTRLWDPVICSTHGLKIYFNPVLRQILLWIGVCVNQGVTQSFFPTKQQRMETFRYTDSPAHGNVSQKHGAKGVHCSASSIRRWERVPNIFGMMLGNNVFGMRNVCCTAPAVHSLISGAGIIHRLLVQSNRLNINENNKANK